MSVGVPMMVVEDENRRYDRRSHHEHDAIEVSSCVCVCVCDGKVVAKVRFDLVTI